MGKIIVFYGIEEENIEEYIRDFRRSFIGNEEKKSDDGLNLLLEFLEKDALGGFEEQPKEKKISWEVLMKSLIEEFIHDEQYDKVMDEVRHLQQESHEKVKKYVEQVKKLENHFQNVLWKDGNDITILMVGIMAIITNKFISGLKP